MAVVGLSYLARWTLGDGIERRLQVGHYSFRLQQRITQSLPKVELEFAILTLSDLSTYVPVSKSPPCKPL